MWRGFQLIMPKYQDLLVLQAQVQVVPTLQAQVKGVSPHLLFIHLESDFGVVDLHALEKELVGCRAALPQVRGQVVGQVGQVLDLLGSTSKYL